MLTDARNARQEPFRFGRARLFEADCFEWLRSRRANSVHAVVTDPPFGVEYSHRELELRRNGNRGGIWRLPPDFDGWTRAPLPRFTVLSEREIAELMEFFSEWAELVHRVLVPGAHMAVACNTLFSPAVATAIEAAGFERRGTVIRLVRTMRGGDRPKHAHEEFPEVSVLPRGMYEPWVLLRKPLDGTVRDNLRKWRTGGLRRPEVDRPFGDVIVSGRAPGNERAIAPHPSLKPQAFLRQLVRAMLPLASGVLLDPFAGSGSTLAAACAMGYHSVGIEHDPTYAELARRAIPALAALGMPAKLSPSAARSRAAVRRRRPAVETDVEPGDGAARTNGAPGARNGSVAPPDQNGHGRRHLPRPW